MRNICNFVAQNRYKPMSIYPSSRLIKAVTTTLLCIVAIPATSFGQDLLANQAPIDRRLKAVDSVALQRLIHEEVASNGDELYTSWVNDKAHCYSSEAVPDSFRIDLRGFAMPTPSRTITSNYGYRPAFHRMHKGLDIKVYTGDTIVAAFDGKVRVVRYDAGGYGNFIVIRHHNGLETIYGHLSKQLVSVNDGVKAGEVIGLGGNTGRSFGSHLHFETRIAGEPIDPKLLFDFPNQDVTGDFYVFHKSENKQRNDNAVASSKGTSRATETPHDGGHFYQVKNGDTLSSIARKLGISVSALCNSNNLSVRSKLRPRQILKY